jgi:hypothetical protein
MMMTADEISGGLISAIKRVDNSRSPISLNVFRTYKILFLYDRKKKYVKKNHPAIYNDIHDLFKAYKKRMINNHIRGLFEIKYLLLVLMAIMITFIWDLFLLYFFSFNDLTNILLSVPVFSFLGGIIIVKYLIPKTNVVALEYDQDLILNVQKIISNLREVLVENSLNPKDFPIELRHNDYEGLEYVEKKKGVYTAYVKL